MAVGWDSVIEAVQGPVLKVASIPDPALGASHPAIEEAVVKEYLVFLSG